MSSRGLTHGRGRGRSKNTSTKRSAPVDSNYEEAAAPKKSGRKKLKVGGTEAANGAGTATPLVEPRRPSERSTQVINPGKPDVARPKRTHTEVEAEVRRKAEAIDERARRCQAAIAEIAAIEAEQDEAEREEEENTIFSLEDLPEDVMDVDSFVGAGGEGEHVLEFTQQDFDHIEDDEAYLSATEFDRPKGKAPAVTAAVMKKAKKPSKKGETRAEIEAAAKVLVAEKRKVADAELPVKKKGVQNSNAAAASTKAGLSKMWKTLRAPAQASPPASPKLGGSADDDTSATRPDFEPNTRPPRKNNMITILGSSDTEDTPSRASSKVTARPVRKHRTSIKPELSSKIPAFSLGNAQTPKLKIKNELSSSSFTPDVAADIKGVPAFIAKTWTTRFLPAAYRALHRSDDPMALGTVGRDIKNLGQVTVAVLQLVLDEVYPGNTWEIEWGDPICAKAVSHLGERRSAIGRAALQAVDRAFEAAKYYGVLDSPTPGVRNTEAIKSDALYAVQRNGPAFWKYPTPKSCTLDPKDPEYIVCTS
ncbi:hypothetical protein B0H10DRAFT_2304026 [Mycena sp. CBHHK59/15]|nr:hypothetical protein B0H10DRAFT_2304026 [Mycena sp. CBHHK59/15]